MTDVRELNINIPFCGFYNSLYSGEIDSIEERECENFADEKELEHAPELRIDGKEYWEILYRHSSYSLMHDKIAEIYADTYSKTVGEEIGIPLKLRYETMISPREYNFTTDRIFCWIPADVVAKLFRMSRKDNHQMLAAAIKERFTSYDGFISGYSNRLDVWLEKRLSTWDHNELGTLLVACHVLAGRDEDWDMDVYYSVVDGDAVYSAWSDGVDWAKVDADVAELRAEKEAEARVEDPDYIPPPVRCPLTLDLFEPRA